MAEPRDPTDDDLRNAIKGILAKEDLSSLSSKKVRKMLEELFSMDLAEKKQEIDQMLMAMINEKNDEHHSDEGEAVGEDAQSSFASANGTNGASSSKPESSDESDDPGVDDSPPRKKQKPGSGKAKKSAERIDDASDSDSDDLGHDTDAAMARKMQKEEMGIRTRNNRRGVERKPKPTKEPKSKAGPRTGKSLYSQECVLSEELAAVMGADRMARKDVVSRMWQIFKERNMMDPKNRQFVLCDDELLKVFKVRKFRAFGMMKFLKNHIKDAKLVTS